MKTYQFLFHLRPREWAFGFHSYAGALLRIYRWVLCFGPFEVRRFHDDD